jgi:hypothetical protein
LPKYREYATKIYLCFTFEKTKMAAQSSLPGAFFKYVIWKIWQTCPKKLAKLVRFTMKKKFSKKIPILLSKKNQSANHI